MPLIKGRSIILVPLIGASLVWCSFHLSGSLATTISPRFFRQTPALATIAYFSSFIIGLIVRPVGALIFGRVGDRKGRKQALSQTLFLTGIATVALGALPEYVFIGVTAPIALLVLRILQGLAFGGVFAGAVLYVAEWTAENRRGFATSWIQMAPILGLLLSIGVISVTRDALGQERFQIWGWRITFGPSLILVGLSLYMRRMEETPIYRQLKETTSKRDHGMFSGNNLNALLTALSLAAGQAAIWYMTQFYLMFHLQNVLRVNPFVATRVVVIALVLGLPFLVLFGALSDKVGRRKLILLGGLLAAVLYIPTYAGMQRAAGTNVVTIKPGRNSVTGAPGPTSLTFAEGVLKPVAESSNPNVIALTSLVLLLVIILSMVSGPLGAYLAESFPTELRCRSMGLSYNLAHGVTGTLLPFFSLPLLVNTGDIYAGLYYALAIIVISLLVAVFAMKFLKTRASFIVATLLLLLSPQFALAADFKREVIYQIMTDRFVDGDPSNNDPPQSAGMHDPTRTNWQAYWGGDLEGIRQKISYLAGMGVTAIWISLPADNVNVLIRTSRGEIRTPYYGYQPRDLKRIEEHFGDINNSWLPFDNLVTAAHEQGIKVIVDFTPNHSNAMRTAEDGAVYDNGQLIGNYSSDPSGYFHHFSFISDPNHPFETQYFSLYGLSDLAQENPRIDEYLKSAAHLFQQHGADGFRLDAFKHISWGWLPGFANSVYANGDSFIFGEWYLENTVQPLYWDYAFSNSIYTPGDEHSFSPEHRGVINDSLYPDAFKTAGRSGISLTDFPLQSAITRVFGSADAAFSEIDAVISQMSEDVADANSLVTFIDNHDQRRFLSSHNSQDRLHLALAFLLTARGIPCIYYGTEQYLHNNTAGGGDPYNRPMMDSFSTSTPAYSLINKLSALRRKNPAIAYGSTERRRLDHDVYIYERKFSDHVVLVAINKSGSESRTIDRLHTSLPAGSYSDYLEGRFGGPSIRADANSVASFTLPPNTVAVWSYMDSGDGGPHVGSVSPRLGQPGMKVKINGDKFGRTAGTVRFGTARAEVVSWGETEITVIVPPVQSGEQHVTVTASGGLSNHAEFTVLTAGLVPVVFNVKYASRDSHPGRVFVTGNVAEMGSWNATWRDAMGPLVTPNGKDWTMCASLPAGQTIQFRFFRITSGGRIVWAGGDVHTYTVPTTGVGRVEVQWSD